MRFEPTRLARLRGPAKGQDTCANRGCLPSSFTCAREWDFSRCKLQVGRRLHRERWGGVGLDASLVPSKDRALCGRARVTFDG